MENQEEEHTCMTDEEREALSRTVPWSSPSRNSHMNEIAKEARIRWENCKECQRWIKELERRNK